MTETETMLLRRHEMVSRQLRPRGIRDERILEAFMEVPREMFVPDDQVAYAYEDHPVGIGRGQTISQPFIVAMMVQLLDVRNDHRVLDVGAGSGYQTAILCRLSGHVFAIERIEELTEQAAGVLASLGVANASFCTGDGSLGWPDEAPFDRIICGAASPDVPNSWVEQLADGGRIVAPIGRGDYQQVVQVDKQGGSVTRLDLDPVRFVPLIGRQAWPDSTLG